MQLNGSETGWTTTPKSLHRWNLQQLGILDTRRLTKRCSWPIDISHAPLVILFCTIVLRIIASWLHTWLPGIQKKTQILQQTQKLLHCKSPRRSAPFQGVPYQLVNLPRNGRWISTSTNVQWFTLATTTCTSPKLCQANNDHRRTVGPWNYH